MTSKLPCRVTKTPNNINNVLMLAIGAKNKAHTIITSNYVRKEREQDKYKSHLKALFNHTKTTINLDGPTCTAYHLEDFNGRVKQWNDTITDKHG